MGAPRRQPSTARVIVAILIALVAMARGGGVAIACESVAAASQGTAHGGGEHSAAPQHEQPEHEGCDTPERVNECLLMPACAPAVSEAAVDVGDSPTPPTMIVRHSTPAPTPVDRAPEPPPPRA